MKLSAPRMITWVIALVLGVVGILGMLLAIPGLSGIAPWLVVLGWLVLAVATAVEGI